MVIRIIKNSNLLHKQNLFWKLEESKLFTVDTAFFKENPKTHFQKDQVMYCSKALLRMGFFGVAHAKSPTPCPKICRTYCTMMELGIVISYL